MTDTAYDKRRRKLAELKYGKDAKHLNQGVIKREGVTDHYGAPVEGKEGSAAAGAETLGKGRAHGPLRGMGVDDPYSEWGKRVANNIRKSHCERPYVLCGLWKGLSGANPTPQFLKL